MPQFGVPAHILMRGGRKWLKKSNKNRVREHRELTGEMLEMNSIDTKGEEDG